MVATHTVRVDAGSLERLRGLAALLGRPVADIVRTLSYASLDEVLRCTASRAVAEQPKAGGET